MHLVLAGAIATALSVVALYNPPLFENQLQQWVLFLVLNLIFGTSLGLFSIPYSAMVGDYTDDRQEKAVFIAWKMAFANLGVLLGIGVPGYYLIQGDANVYGSTVWILVMLVLLVGFLTSLAPPPLSRSLPVSNKVNPPPVEKSHPLWQALSNRVFLFPLAASFLAGMGVSLSVSMALYFYRIRIQISEQEIQNALILFFVISSLSFPAWLWASRKWGRKKTLLAGCLFFALTNSLILPGLHAGQVLPVYFGASLVGGFLIGCLVLFDSVLIDVIDEDHLRSGQERLGLYFGIWRFAGRLSRVLAVFLVGFLLDWANIAFPDVDTSRRLALIFGPGVGFFFGVAALFLFVYPLTEKKCQDIQLALEQRQNGSNLPKRGT